MKTSSAGRAAITQREGNKLKAYRDTKGIWTIGVGHTAAAGAPAPKAGMTITAAKSDEILARDLADVEAAVNSAVKVPVSQNQFDAMVSLAFNIGNGGFKRSTVVKRLNAGDVAGAGAAFMMWNKPKEIIGRRKTEQKQFLSGGKAPRKPTKPTKPAIAGDLTMKQVNSVMHLGSKGDFVKDLQRSLNRLGYGPLEEDGHFGEGTDLAVKTFQKDANLELVDGWAGPATVGAIAKELEKRKTAPKMAAAEKVVDAATGSSGLGGFSKTEIVAAVAGTTGTANAVKEGVDAVNSTTSSFMDLVSAVGPWVLLALVLAGGAAFIVWDRRRKRLEAVQVQKVL